MQAGYGGSSHIESKRIWKTCLKGYLVLNVHSIKWLVQNIHVLYQF